MPQAMTMEELELSLKTVTDRLSILDDLVRGKKHMVFRCSHSGLYFPADYLKEWGRKYGKGLGPEPVSECLDTDYNMPVVARAGVQSHLDCIHPFGVTRAQVDCVFLPEVEPGERLILHEDDPSYRERVKIIREKQLVNPRSKIFQMVQN